MTKREALVRLVTAQMPNALEKSGDSTKVMVENALHVLAEIEKVCPERPPEHVALDLQYQLDDAAKEIEALKTAVDAQREKDAKVAEGFRGPHDRYESVPSIAAQIAAAIRGGGQ